MSAVVIDLFNRVVPFARVSLPLHSPVPTVLLHALVQLAHHVHDIHVRIVHDLFELFLRTPRAPWVPIVSTGCDQIMSTIYKVVRANTYSCT